jgi:hypothetical protein
MRRLLSVLTLGMLLGVSTLGAQDTKPTIMSLVVEGVF